MRPGSELDAARARVVEHGLTARAVGQLTDAVSGLSLEALAPVKQHLKRFFSDRRWTEDDDEALADAVGAGVGGGRHELEPGLTLVWGWADGRFQLRVESDRPVVPPGLADLAAATDLGPTFEGVVVPEATPSPRTIRFATPPLHRGPSRAYSSAVAAGTHLVTVQDNLSTQTFRSITVTTSPLMRLGHNLSRASSAHARATPALQAPATRRSACFSSLATPSPSA